MTQGRVQFRTAVCIPAGEGVSLRTARLALLARAWADAEGGEFILLLTGEWKGRKAAAALEDLGWLGVTWEGVVSATEAVKVTELREAAEAWRGSGVAYPCDCQFPVDRLCRCARLGSAGRGKAKALKVSVPDEPIVLKDRVLGSVLVAPKRLGGWRLFDHEGTASPLAEEALALRHLRLTHLFSDASPELAATLSHILKASGATVPEFAHIPPLRTAGGGAPDLGALHQAGFLPGVLRMALLSAGLSSAKEGAVVPKRGSFGGRAGVSFQKLRALNRAAIRESDPAMLAESVAPALVAAGLLQADWAEEESVARFVRALAGYLRGRICLLSEAAEALSPIFCYDPERIAPCGQAALAEPEAALALCAFAEKVEASNLRQQGAYSRISRALAARLDMKLARFERYLAAGLLGRAKPAELRALLPLLADGCALELPTGVAGPVERAWDAYYRLALPHQS